MSELKITSNSLENAILTDGNFVSGYAVGNAYIDASGNGAHAEGYTDGNNMIIASGQGAHAEGYNTLALDLGAHAEGWGTTAFGTASHAEGYNTLAGGIDEIFKNTNLNSTYSYNGHLYEDSKLYISAAAPNDMQINDILKLLDNRYTISSIQNSPTPDRYIRFTNNLNDSDATWALTHKILKMYNEPVGLYSHAGGLGTIANEDAMTAIGKYNDTSKGAYFVVGNGNSTSSRKDAFVVGTNGNVQIGGSITKVSNVSINDNVTIGGTATAKVNNVENVQLGLPIGSITMWAGETAPDGWLLCDGRGIAIAGPYSEGVTVHLGFKNYQNLVNIIKNKYGSDLGSPTWVPHTGTITGGYYVLIPNLQQRFPMGAKDGSIGKNGHNSDSPGWNTSLGYIGGEPTNTLGIYEMPAHNHSLEHFSTSGNISDVQSAGRITIRDTDSGQDLSSSGFIDYTGGDNAHNNMPPFLALNFIIKYK